jgi:hypothetical protein
LASSAYFSRPRMSLRFFVVIGVWDPTKSAPNLARGLKGCQLMGTVWFSVLGVGPVLYRGAQRCALFRGRMAIRPYRGSFYPPRPGPARRHPAAFGDIGGHPQVPRRKGGLEFSQERFDLLLDQFSDFAELLGR